MTKNLRHLRARFEIQASNEKMFLYRMFLAPPPPLKLPSVRYKVNLIAKVHSLLTVIITPGMKNPRHKKPRHKKPGAIPVKTRPGKTGVK